MVAEVLGKEPFNRVALLLNKIGAQTIPQMNAGSGIKE